MTNLALNYNNITLNIGRLLPKSQVNGPGVRFVIWLQGCSLHCSGCINQEFWSQEPNQLMSVQELYEQIISTPGIEGVTYSGGEPFEQAEGLCSLSRLLREANLTIMAYSGYTYQELINRHDRHISELLFMLDILLDGRFEIENAAPLLWRGSHNQQVHFLTARYKQYEEQVNREGVEMEFSFAGTECFVTGNFNQELLQKIREKLREDYGVVLSESHK